MPTTAKASPRSSAGRASASVLARTITLTAPLASSVCTMLRLNSLRSLFDDRDWDLAQNLTQIRLRVIDAVDQRRQHQQAERAGDREHAPPLGGKGSAYSARRGGSCRRLRRGRRAGRACCDRAQSKERQQRIERGQGGQDG